jgi:hypothetical protein
MRYTILRNWYGNGNGTSGKNCLGILNHTRLYQKRCLKHTCWWIQNQESASSDSTWNGAYWKILKELKECHSKLHCSCILKIWVKSTWKTAECEITVNFSDVSWNQIILLCKTCHLKTRRKVPYHQGEEVEIKGNQYKEALKY